MLALFDANFLLPNYEFLLTFLSIPIFVRRMQRFQLLPFHSRSTGAGDGECRHPCGALDIKVLLMYTTFWQKIFSECSSTEPRRPFVVYYAIIFVLCLGHGTCQSIFTFIFLKRGGLLLIQYCIMGGTPNKNTCRTFMVPL